MEEEKKPLKANKFIGLLSLILAILLTINILSNFSKLLWFLVDVFLFLFGRFKFPYLPRDVGYFLAELLFVYLAYRLYKYSNKTLFKNSENSDDVASPENTEK